MSIKLFLYLFLVTNSISEELKKRRKRLEMTKCLKMLLLKTFLVLLNEKSILISKLFLGRHMSLYFGVQFFPEAPSIVLTPIGFIHSIGISPEFIEIQIS